jgi:hypothetical protein
MSETLRMLRSLTLRLLAWPVSALLLLALATPDADARRGRGGHGDHDDAMRYLDEGRSLPLEKITRIATSAVGGGEVIEIEFKVRDGRPVCEVKIIDRSGRLREVYVDAQTGKVLKVEGAGRRDRGSDDNDDDD